MQKTSSAGMAALQELQELQNTIVREHHSYILIHSHAKNARQLTELPDPAVQSHMPIYRE
jgi:hypothetical protein